jgi:endonuclease/exonuclease/phosphatase family metal-dependent hydrolase/membrane-associated phospholipid phosphatase
LTDAQPVRTEERSWWLPTAAVAAAVVLAGAWVLASREVGDWEVDLGRWAYDLPDAFRPVLEAVMQTGTQVAPLVAAILLAGFAGWRWRAAGVLAAGWATWLSSWAIKAIVDRPRPTEAELQRQLRIQLDNGSFTSSHAAIAAALATSLLLLGRPRRPVAAVLVVVPVLTGLARMHLAAHWALDVIGGAALGVLVAIGVSYLVGLPPGGPVARAGAEDEVVIASFNVRNGRAWDKWESWPLRARTAARYARGLGADILGVQEAFGFQVRFLGAALPGYEVVGRGRGAKGGEWCPLFVRADRFEVLDAATQWFGETPDIAGSRLPSASFPRIATRVRLRVRDTGQVVEVVNTHFDERHPENRLQSARQVVGWLDPGEAHAVMGDLNATWKAEHELFAVLTDAGLRDAFPAGAEHGGTAHDFRGGTRHRRIDHLFLSEHFTVVSATVVADERTRRFPSDHWAVRAVTRLSAATPNA